METLTIVLLVAIAIFAIGNILLYFLEKKSKENRLPLGEANNEVVSSKLDVLNKRVSRLEQNKNETIKKEVIVLEKPKKISIKKKEKSKPKNDSYPITKYKRKKKK